MRKQKLILHVSGNNKLRSVIKNNHGRIIYFILKKEDKNYIIDDCYYVDRLKSGKYYAIPKNLKTISILHDDLLMVIANELDRKYYDYEVSNSLSELGTDEFIQYKLLELTKGYKFLIFVGEGKLIDGIPSIVKTRFKNRLHRTIYIEIQYKYGMGVITDCHYCDRTYKERSKVIPPALYSVHFEYTKNSILNIINNELNINFNHIIFITDGSINLDNNLPLCGSI